MKAHLVDDNSDELTKISGYFIILSVDGKLLLFAWNLIPNWNLQQISWILNIFKIKINPYYKCEKESALEI